MSPTTTTTTTPLPIIVLIHGAWHTPAHYTLLTSSLQSLGYNVLTPSLPSGSYTSAPTATLADDAQSILTVLAPHIARGRRIVLLAHSYGGLPATAAAAAINTTVRDRAARGLPGGVERVVYLCAFAPPAAELSLLSMVGGTPDFANVPDWWDVHHQENYLTIGARAVGVLYQDVEPGVAAKALAGTGRQSLGSFAGAGRHAAGQITATVTYVVATLDQAIPVEAQRAMAAAAGAEVVEIETGHSPFLRQEWAARVVGIVTGLVGDETRDEVSLSVIEREKTRVRLD